MAAVATVAHQTSASPIQMKRISVIESSWVLPEPASGKIKLKSNNLMMNISKSDAIRETIKIVTFKVKIAKIAIEATNRIKSLSFINRK